MPGTTKKIQKWDATGLTEITMIIKDSYGQLWELANENEKWQFPRTAYIIEILKQIWIDL